MSHFIYSLVYEILDVTMKKLKQLTKDEYKSSIGSGMHWEWYPESTGIYNKDMGETMEDENLDVDVGASKAQLKKAFGKMANGKTTNRPLLNNFVKMVA